MILLRTKIFGVNQVNPAASLTLGKKLSTPPSLGKKPALSPTVPKKNNSQTAIQLAKMRQQNENLRHQRATQKLQLDKQKLGVRAQIATQKRLQALKDNQIRVKKLEMNNTNKSQMDLFKAKPKDSGTVIVSM